MNFMKKAARLLLVATAMTSLISCKPGPIYPGSFIGTGPQTGTVVDSQGQPHQVSYHVSKRHIDAVPQSRGTNLITNKILAEYAQDPLLQGSHINVKTDWHGEVTLSGQVPNKAARAYAIKIARNTKSVMAVNAKNLVVVNNN